METLRQMRESRATVLRVKQDGPHRLGYTHRTAMPATGRIALKEESPVREPFAAQGCKRRALPPPLLVRDWICWSIRN
ncbi:MAG: hypothetical protein LBV61_05405 [Burkholderiaceae bacterium]|jgi:hypothetical protein|nr:hypothetical protein [Burkholderiaceae bacterium]